MDYGKFKKKTYESTQKKSNKSKFTSSAPMTVLAADFNNSKEDTRIGTGFIFQSGKYAGEGFTISCDPDDRSKKLWYERRHTGLTIISNQKFSKKSGPVTVLVEDEEATNKSGLTARGCFPVIFNAQIEVRYFMNGTSICHSESLDEANSFPERFFTFAGCD